MPSEERTPIVFTVTVSQRDWDAGLGGWRCPALKIPGARVAEIYVAGASVDDSLYTIKPEHDLVRWSRGVPPPKQAIISIRLTEELSSQRLTLRWQKLAILLPLITALLVASITRYSLCPPSPPPSTSKESAVFNLSTPVRGDCGVVTINGSVELPPGAQGKITRLLWEWGDGDSVDSFPPVSHRYLGNAKYSAKVTAYSGNNEVGGQTIPINISNAEQPMCIKPYR